MITREIKESIEESVLCWLATTNDSGQPNVSPKEMFTTHGEHHILVANIASPNSVGNIKTNPKVCVSFIDIFKQKGYKIHGEANLVEASDPAFESKVTLLKNSEGDEFPVKGIIEIKVKSISQIIAPSYWLYPDKTTEASHIERSLESYGVKKISED